MINNAIFLTIRKNYRYIDNKDLPKIGNF